MVRISAALCLMLCIILAYSFWPGELQSRAFSDMLEFHLFNALEACGVFLIGAVVAGYVARQRVMVPALVLSVTFWTGGLLLLSLFGPDPRFGRPLELLAWNTPWLIGSVVGTVIGAYVGGWLYRKSRLSRGETA